MSILNAPVEIEEKDFDVWIEGYSATGQSSKAEFLGKYKAKTFKEACSKWAALNNPSYYNEASNAYWGCRFFDNEQAARKAFG